ncbi:AtpZ/AtpI family protein [Arcticibacterium luteifluviistationis]|uniref:ATP synthase subunit n=1 Tax=Arcticibacterium luteifluviistationis TaxID=1784714 RepID=A0A2Z4G6N7_9BACT|nr:AtpZ/AtpI family protein [Arcticibacterium luteifluviistationis]AWV96794.1 ATP synthase subunit [Arcticibacterium luteifluviistationis]
MIPGDNKEAFEFSEKVKEKAQRKLDAKDNDQKSVWFGLGMMGIVGWTIVGPTLLGAALGLWLDKRYPETFSWTLSGLIIGLFAGCLVAWRWINKEHQEINQNKKDE